MNEFLLIVGMFLVTFGVRYPVLAFVSRIELPEIISQGLKYVPGTVLMAIILPAMLIPAGGKVDFSISNTYLYAGIVAILVSWRTKNLLLTIVVGMAALWMLRWLLV